MKHFNYFKLKLSREIPNIQELTDKKISFKNGIYMYYDFNDIQGGFDNTTYKQDTYEIINDFKKRLSVIREGGFQTVYELFIQELSKEEYTIEFLEGDTQDAVKIVRLSDGLITVNSTDRGIMFTQLFQETTIPAIIDEITLHPSVSVEEKEELLNDPNLHLKEKEEEVLHENTDDDMQDEDEDCEDLPIANDKPATRTNLSEAREIVKRNNELRKIEEEEERKKVEEEERERIATRDKLMKFDSSVAKVKISTDKASFNFKK